MQKGFALFAPGSLTCILLQGAVQGSVAETWYALYKLADGCSVTSVALNEAGILECTLRSSVPSRLM